MMNDRQIVPHSSFCLHHFFSPPIISFIDWKKELIIQIRKKIIPFAATERRDALFCLAGSRLAQRYELLQFNADFHSTHGRRARGAPARGCCYYDPDDH
jgi:hypothetical protein